MLNAPIETPASPATLLANGDVEGDALSAHKLFEMWSRASASKATKSLNERSIQNYRSTWLNWTQWLPPTTPWEKATPDQVTEYLQQLTASARARMKQVNLTERPASPVTRHRYWRVLRDIYNFAVILELCEANPCTDASEVPRNEVMASMVLPPWALQQLHDGILEEHAKRKVSTWQQRRDDALMLLLIATGAKTGELTAMRADQITRIQGDSVLQGHWGVSVDGGRGPQQRKFTIKDPRVCAVLATWWQARQELTGTPPWLFFGAKSEGEGTDRQRTALTAKSVFLLVANTVKTHLPANAFAGPLSHVGAETIRNSVLSRWLLENVPPEIVMKRAGVAELRAVDRLTR